MGTLYRFRFFCQVVCCAIALGAFCRFFRPRFAISPYYKRTYANFTQKEMANIRYRHFAPPGQLPLCRWSDGRLVGYSEYSDCRGFVGISGTILSFCSDQIGTFPWRFEVRRRYCVYSSPFFLVTVVLSTYILLVI